jgi:hypothetical protein
MVESADAAFGRALKAIDDAGERPYGGGVLLR